MRGRGAWRVPHEQKDDERREHVEQHMVCDARGACFVPGLQVSLMYHRGLTFCFDCPDAHDYGTHVDVWDSHHGPVRYHVGGKLVYAVPNDARSRILNQKHVKGHVVLVDRGTVGLVAKVKHVQDAGAVGVIIVDTGVCTVDFDCGAIGKRELGRGFAIQDGMAQWDEIYIPSVMVHKEDGERLKSNLDLETFEVPGLGLQWFHREWDDD